MRKYKPATFQPTVRPDWAGVLSYLSDKEKGEILEAILKYPSFETESRFFNETVKPDLDMQFAEFVRICQARQRGINNRWQKNRESQDSAEKRGKISIPYVDDMNDSSYSYVVVPEGEGEEEGKGGGERKGKGKSKEIDSFHLEKQDETQDEKQDENAFNDFWRVYPKDRAGNKAKALQAYQRALKEGRASSCDEINQAAEVYARSDEVKRGFAKGAAAWLNDDRFKSKYKTEDGKGLDGLTDFQRDVINSMNW